MTISESEVPPAWLVYVPADDDTVTAKWIEVVPEAATAIGPAQVSRLPVTSGSADVAPLVDPAMKLNPPGRSSTIPDSDTAKAFGLATVIV
jgi:hypothetical protein